jgi:hypothetical protein
MEVSFVGVLAHLVAFMLVRRSVVHIIFVFMVDLKFKEVDTLLV